MARTHEYYKFNVWTTGVISKTTKTSFYQDKRHYFTTEQQNHYYKGMSSLQWLDLKK